MYPLPQWEWNSHYQREEGPWTVPTLALALVWQENGGSRLSPVSQRGSLSRPGQHLNTGKEFFRNRGCIGCHRYEGFDVEAEALINARQAIRRLETERQQTTRLIDVTTKNADAASDNTEAQKLYARADALRQDISTMDHHLEQLDIQSRSLLREQKKVGPSLKEVRVKMHKEWIPVWLEEPACLQAHHQNAGVPVEYGTTPCHCRLHLAVGGRWTTATAETGGCRPRKGVV